MKKNNFDSNKLFLKNMPAFFDYINSKQIFPMILLLGGGYIFTLLPSILGLVALFVLYAVAFKLAVDILVETANGNMNPGDYQSSFEAKNILIQFVLVGLIQVGILIWLKFFVVDALLIVAYILLSTFITPAIFMVLSITSSLTQAINPVVIVKLIRPWFFTYLIFVCFWVSLEIFQNYMIGPIVNQFPSVFAGIISHFIKFYLLILNFHIMGFLIYQNRHSFGFEASFDEDLAKDTPLIEQQSLENPIYKRLKSLIAGGDYRQAQSIIDELKSEGDSSKELIQIELLNSASSNEGEIALLSASEKIHKYLSENQYGNAFSTYQKIILDNERYVEIEAQDISKLAHFAFQSGKYSMVKTLLKFFHNKYPNHEDIVPNYFLIVQILYQEEKSKNKAKLMLNKLIKKFPSHKSKSELVAWLKGIDLMERK